MPTLQHRRASGSFSRRRGETLLKARVAFCFAQLAMAAIRTPSHDVVGNALKIMKADVTCEPELGIAPQESRSRYMRHVEADMPVLSFQISGRSASLAACKAFRTAFQA
jgi:hypothetical protein